MDQLATFFPVRTEKRFMLDGNNLGKATSKCVFVRINLVSCFFYYIPWLIFPVYEQECQKTSFV